MIMIIKLNNHRLSHGLHMGNINYYGREENKNERSGGNYNIVKRRLGILRKSIDELGLKLEIILVSSEKNKADALTRVPLSWIKSNKTSEET